MKQYTLTESSNFGIEIYDTRKVSLVDGCFECLYSPYGLTGASVHFITTNKIAESDSLEELYGILAMNAL